VESRPTALPGGRPENHGRFEGMTRHSPTCSSLLISKTETSRMHQNIHPAGTVRDAQLQIVVWRECGQALAGLGRVPRQPHTPFAVFLQRTRSPGLVIPATTLRKTAPGQRLPVGAGLHLHPKP
jgi:hypothetical protein